MGVYQFKKQFFVIVLCCSCIAFAALTAGTKRGESQAGVTARERRVQATLVKQLSGFQAFLQDSILPQLHAHDLDEGRLRQDFLRARKRFKQFEWATSYFTADLSKRLNGPPVQEIENADLLDPTLARPVDPSGLQLIEEMLFPTYNPGDKEALIRQVALLIRNSKLLVHYFSDHKLADWRILDAAKLAVFRVITLGITGYDNGRSLQSMEESAESLHSLRQLLQAYAPKKAPLLATIDSSIDYLLAHPNFEDFDRATFIVEYANKVSTGIAQIQMQLPGKPIVYNRMLRQSVNTLFDIDAFQVDAFSPGPEARMSAEKVRLGERLFYDGKLASTGNRSCASCHRPDLAFTDGLARPTDIHQPQRLLQRNTPTLLNAALQSNYFYDMRALTLEDQVLAVLQNKQEMDGSIPAILAYVGTTPAYQVLLQEAFPELSNTEVQAAHIANALATYIRSLTRLNSRFDSYMQGDAQALTAEELHGFNLFMGKAKCATCHFMPLFNGITPPKYTSSESEVLGLLQSPKELRLDSDLGYYSIIGVASFRHAFKIPTVRNILKTAPYMHHGSYETLEEVLDFYNQGGGAGMGLEVANQTLPSEQLNLSASEIHDIISFLSSLESL